MTGDNEILQRMVRVETKLDMLLEQVEKLPPSPVCVVKHREIDTTIETIGKTLSTRIDQMEKWQNRVVGGFLAFNVILLVAMEKIRYFFFGGFPK